MQVLELFDMMYERHHVFLEQRWMGGLPQVLCMRATGATVSMLRMPSQAMPRNVVLLALQDLP